MEFSKKFVCECTEYSTYFKNVPAPVFRKSFTLDAVPDSAEILICGLGFYDLFVNGEKITKGLLAPYISNSDHICYFDKYDLRAFLREGENVIGVMLGDGLQVGKTCLFNLSNNVMNSAPMLALTAEITCGNNVLRFEADDFVCKKGPIIFNDLRSGVFYDARMEEPGWNAPGFTETDWHKPVLSPSKPRGTAKLCEAEPVHILREIKPVSIKKGSLAPYYPRDDVRNFLSNRQVFETPAESEGGFIYDFGENNSGVLRLKIRGERGQKISLQCSEQLRDGKVDYSNIYFYPDGFSQRDIYYAKGEGEETFETMFTYHGFRYVYVSGITEEQATADLLTYSVISSDMEKRGDFECSDSVANQIYQMTLRSDSSNFVYFPTDCPHREKNGWTGDASISAEHMILTRGVENSWREWLNNIRASQKENGQLPGIVPTSDWGYEWGNGPAWDSVVFNLPYFAYKFRGETDIIRENADTMLRYLEYISRRRDAKGIIAVGLGDWLAVDRNDGGKKSDAELGFTDSVMVLDMCRKGAEMFGKVGLSLHKAFAEKLGEEMLTAIRNEYVDFETYIVRGEYQTTQAMAIFYDVFRPEEKERAFKVLLDFIHRDNDSFTCGFLGMRVLFHVLAEFGEADLAYKMITKPEFPSYGYWAKKGETTLLENFAEYDEFYDISKNHHFLGDVANWFMSRLGGIRVIGANEVRISPCFVSALDWCRTSHKLPEGEIEVCWTRCAEGIKLSVNSTGAIKYTVELAPSDDNIIVETKHSR